MRDVGAETINAGVVARDFGPRGSRNALGDSDPACVLPDAARAILAAVPQWWALRARASGLTGAWTDVEHALDVELPAEIQGVRPRPGVAAALSARGLGTAYVSSLSPQVRSRHGRHYTPENLATELWDMARRAAGMGRGRAVWLPGLVRDPACGAGALLLAPLREHLSASRIVDPQVVIAGLPFAIEGIDADPAAAWLASVILAAEALPLLAAVPERRRRPLPRLARSGDGLGLHESQASIVLMNPPYGRVRLTEADRSRFANTIYGHANLYGLFIAAALDDLAASGVLAALVPTSFASGLYFRNLRTELGKAAPVREIAFVNDRGGVFDGVLQETCLATFARRRTRRTTIASLNGARSEVAQVPTPRSGAPWLLPRSATNAVVAAAAIKMPTSLGKSGWRVSTGPLVWNRRKGDLHDTPGPNRVPIIWAADLDGGRLHRDAARDHMRYLELSVHSDHKVMVLDKPAVLVQRTTAPEQHRRLVAVELSAEDLAVWDGRVVVENHVNVIRPISDEPSLTLQTLNAVLATDTLDRIVRCMSGSVAVSAYELESLPLPDDSVLATWNAMASGELRRAVAAQYEPVQV
jgi:adenine-specific DNA-methyltransferase